MGFPRGSPASGLLVPPSRSRSPGPAARWSWGGRSGVAVRRGGQRGGGRWAAETLQALRGGCGLPSPMEWRAQEPALGVRFRLDPAPILLGWRTVTASTTIRGGWYESWLAALEREIGNLALAQAARGARRGRISVTARAKTVARASRGRTGGGADTLGYTARSLRRTERRSGAGAAPRAA